jgi:RNA polymerase sigma factor (sigma-70 family)
MSPRVSIRLLAVQSDRRLAELAAAGHERAFETVVERYRRPLLRYCRRLGLSESAAEDVLQQALTKAWLALHGGPEVRELRPWLYRIVHNVALNWLRGAHDWRPLDDDPANGSPALAVVGSDGDGERSMEAREALGHVARLPEMQRDVVVLTAIQGRSHEETADALGISDGAVRGLLYRARSTLRSAAAALTPPWLLARAGLGGDVGALSGVLERPTELSLGGGLLGAGVLTKLGAFAATAGVLAAGVAGVAGVPHRHHRAGAGQSESVRGPVPSGGVSSAGASGRVEVARPPERREHRSDGRGQSSARGHGGSSHRGRDDGGASSQGSPGGPSGEQEDSSAGGERPELLPLGGGSDDSLSSRHRGSDGTGGSAGSGQSSGGPGGSSGGSGSGDDSSASPEQVATETEASTNAVEQEGETATRVDRDSGEDSSGGSGGSRGRSVDGGGREESHQPRETS